MSEITRELSLLAGAWTVTSTEKLCPIGPPGVQLCLPNPLRWGLLLGATLGTASAVVITIAPDSRVSSAFGLSLSLSGHTFLLLNYRDNPGMVKSSWYAIASTLNTPILVIEEFAQQ